MLARLVRLIISKRQVDAELSSEYGLRTIHDVVAAAIPKHSPSTRNIRASGICKRCQLYNHPKLWQISRYIQYIPLILHHYLDTQYVRFIFSKCNESQNNTKASKRILTNGQTLRRDMRRTSLLPVTELLQPFPFWADCQPLMDLWLAGSVHETQIDQGTDWVKERLTKMRRNSPFLTRAEKK